MAVTAPTGIAASHINGVTLFSYFGLGMCNKDRDELLIEIKNKSYLRTRYKALEVVIIDGNSPIIIRDKYVGWKHF